MEKLTSVLKQVPWSLVLRAAFFGASWLLFPFWLFLLVGLYLYLVPLFQPFKFALPLVILFIFTAIEPPGFLLAVFFAVLFYLILGIKDLIFIERKSSYQMLVLLLFFTIFLRFFSRFDSWTGFAAIFYSFLVGCVFFFLCKEFLEYGIPDDSSDPGILRKRYLALGVMAFLVWQIVFVSLFLPLNFYYQSAFPFLVSVVFLEFLTHHASHSLTRVRVLTDFSVFFAFLVILLGSAQWGL